MITAWVLYYDGNQHRWQQLTGYVGFNSTNPVDWGLGEECQIMLVLQNASFLGAWLDGNPVA